MAYAVQAQTTQLIKCTKDNVGVRSQPNAKASLIEYSGAHGTFGKVTLAKGEIVYNEGKRVNGFVKISYIGPANLWYDYGWVPAKYLTNTVKCPRCKGKAMYNRKCSICEGNECLNCWYTGKEHCASCEGLGYK